jgi:hypothetical protein
MISSNQLALFSCALVALLFSACGSSDQDSTSKLTTAQFIKQADRICKKENVERIAALKTFSKEQSLGAGEEMTKAMFADVTRETLLPLIQQQIDKLRDMGIPAAAEDRVEAILNEEEAAIEKADAEPLSVLDPETSPFAEPTKKSKSFGFAICAQY